MNIRSSVIVIFFILTVGGCTKPPVGPTPPSEVAFEQCLPENFLGQTQVVFLGPVTYSVGDIWLKRQNDNPPSYEAKYEFTDIVKSATSKPGPDLIVKGLPAKCSHAENLAKDAGINLGAKAKVGAAIPISASAAAAVKNSHVIKVSFDAIAIDQVKFQPKYAEVFASVPDSTPAKQSISTGGYYWAYAMIRVTNYSVDVQYGSTKEAEAAAAANLPGDVGSLNAEIKISKIGNDTLQYTVPGDVYIAAALRPFGPGAVPQGVEERPGPPSAVDYSAPPSRSKT